MYGDNKEEVVQLYLDDIIPNRFQPREVFEEKALKELAVSIKEHGVIQPIIVRNRNSNGKYEIIAGERRYKASALAGLTKIPAIIRNLDDKESSKVALLENLQRKNLNAIEEARTYQKILEIDEMTQEDLAKTMGKSQPAVANKLRLLNLPDEVQESLLKEQISERHARALLAVPDSAKQKELLKKIINEKISVRKLEEEINELYPKENKEEKNVESATNGFLIDKPLMPTSINVETENNYGKVVIAPPDEDNNNNNNKFINYSNKSNNDIDDDILPIINIKSEDKSDLISSNDESPSVDGLINISNDKTNKDEKVDENNNSDDYFSISDLTAINVNSNPAIDNNNQKNDNYTIEDATNKIIETIKDIQSHGIKISFDEMNFPKSYQLIVKIEKE